MSHPSTFSLLATRILPVVLGTLVLSSTAAQVAVQRPADQSPHSSGFVNANSVRLHYLDWGGNGEVLLLLAGGGNDAHIFDTFAPKFVDRWHVIGLTRRGFGESEKSSGGYGTENRVEDLKQFLDGMKIDRTHLVGHSLAGDEMTLFASLYPDRVIKLVYLDAAYDRSVGHDQRLADPFVSPAERKMWLESLDSAEAANVAVPPESLPPPDIYRSMVGLFRAMNTFQLDYSEVRAPSLAFYASLPTTYPNAPPSVDAPTRAKMDAWWLDQRPAMVESRRRNVERFRTEVVGAVIVELPNAPHYLFLGETQNDVVRETRNFLSR
jgi:pimeloyl-ACP methyl ester carboxylesterase